jgi:hypothetical protein
MSPSHTVGLELGEVKIFSRFDQDRSPSHTVGSEQTLKLYYPLMKVESPSHTVGLKHLPKSLKIQASTLSKLKQPTKKAH